MCDSNIKLASADATKVSNMQQKREKEFLIFTIIKPKGKREQLIIKLGMNKEQVTAAMEAGTLKLMKTKEEVIAAMDAGTLELEMTKEDVIKASEDGTLNIVDKEIQLEKKGDETDAWCVYRSALASLPIAFGACYLDFSIVESDSGVVRTAKEMTLHFWNSDNATCKDKMVYAATAKNVFKTFGQKNNNDKQTNEPSELAYDVAVNVFKK